MIGVLTASVMFVLAYAVECHRHQQTRAKWVAEAVARAAQFKEYTEAIAARDRALKALDNALPTIKEPTMAA